jgi:copper chaperone CopZ
VHRRNFIWTLAGAGGGASTALLSLGGSGEAATEDASVTWTVKGFTCLTCAVGLETILHRQQGITRATAAYPSGRVQIGFDSHTIGLPAIKRLIEDMGFEAGESGGA